MKDESKKIHVRKIQVKRGSQAEKELDYKMFLSNYIASMLCIIHSFKIF